MLIAGSACIAGGILAAAVIRDPAGPGRRRAGALELPGSTPRLSGGRLEWINPLARARLPRHAAAHRLSSHGGHLHDEPGAGGPT